MITRTLPRDFRPQVGRDNSHTTMATERSPLLNHRNSGTPAEDSGPPHSAINTPASRLGPLEITAANRRSILAGIYIATFLSVRGMVSQYCQDQRW